MTAPLVFTVPGAPHGKGRARVSRVGGFARLYTPPATVAYEGLIAHAAQQAMAGRPMFDGPVGVLLLIDCPVPASWSKRKQAQALAGEIRPTTKPDVDNVEKAVFDGLNGIAWRDDVQVVDVVKRKAYAATPGVDVQIRTAKVARLLTEAEREELMGAF